MKLYKISQTVNIDYDTYDSAVVAAGDEEDARNIHPYNADDSDIVVPSKGMNLGKQSVWRLRGTWCYREEVTVDYIGEAAPGIARGVIVASFNAG